MLNWPIHGNDYYLNVVNAKPIAREAAYSIAKNQTLGFIYFLQTQLGLKNIGLADDEVNNGMAWMPYNREGRRVQGTVRLNIKHIKTPYRYDLYKTGIAAGDYPVDHHHGQYPGKVPAIQFPQVPSFSIPLGALIPSKIEGLIVCEKGISVSNIANGTTRLQPVVLLTGQAAGVVAAQCIAKKIQPRKAAVRAVQNELLKMKCYLLPFCDIEPGDPAWQAVQKAGALGVLKGVGQSIDWENKTFFYPDSSIKAKDFINELRPYITNPVRAGDGWLSIGEAQQIIAQYSIAVGKEINQERHINKRGFNATVWNDTLHLTNFAIARKITRKELAVLFDYYNDNFVERKIDLKGNLQSQPGIAE